MLLENVDIGQLEQMLKPNMRKAAWPGLTRRHATGCIRKTAEEQDLYGRLARHLLQPKTITTVKRSLYEEYLRTGIRANCDQAMRARIEQIRTHALAVWLKHPEADVDFLQDLLWACCEMSTWIMTAHRRHTVDLGSSEYGRVLAEILWMLAPLLEEEVVQRVETEIDRRVIDPTGDPRAIPGWVTGRNNWNHVCNANVITAALYRIEDPLQLAATIHPLIQHMDYALQAFADDGGCHEGPGYWQYGFGHYVDAAIVMQQRTGGAVNLMAGKKIERICRYPLAARIAGKLRTAFGDASHGLLNPETALEINRFYRMPALYSLCARNRDKTLQIQTWRALCLYRGETGDRDLPGTDFVLPELGQATLHAARSPSTVLAVLAGNNGVSHNHNDIGTFMFYRKGRLMLTDPGAPKYTAKTFSPKRYDILFCRSRGHSVPIINGREQPQGKQYHGILTVEDTSEPGPKHAHIDMTRAYDVPTLKNLRRTFTLDVDGTLLLADRFRFSRKPTILQEAFITFETATIGRNGATVRIGPRSRNVTLTAPNTPGRFRVEKLDAESKEGKEDRIVTRITFEPEHLAARMDLVFEIR